MTSVAPTLQAFFTERLIKQRNVSPRTIASYRDTLDCCSASRRKPPGEHHPNWTGTSSTSR